MTYRQRQFTEDRQGWTEARVARKEEIRDWLQQVKKFFVCKKCGESRSVCLDFHHRNPAEKKFGIGAASTERRSKAEIIEEMKKCDVLCANCHRVEHSKAWIDYS